MACDVSTRTWSCGSQGSPGLSPDSPPRASSPSTEDKPTRPQMLRTGCPLLTLRALIPLQRHLRRQAFLTALPAPPWSSRHPPSTRALPLLRYCSRSGRPSSTPFAAPARPGTEPGTRWCPAHHFGDREMAVRSLSQVQGSVEGAPSRSDLWRFRKQVRTRVAQFAPCTHCGPGTRLAARASHSLHRPRSHRKQNPPCPPCR